MPRPKKTYGEEAPSSITELEPVIKEFIEKIKRIDNEVETLKEERKETLEEYEKKLDIKTLNLALRILKIKEKVEHQDTFDTYEEVLSRIGE